MTKSSKNTPSLAGKFLVAMPHMRDPRFNKAVIYMCVHNAEGAMGLIVNRKMESLSFKDLMEQLNIQILEDVPTITIHTGGPVESGRGFILHSKDYSKSSTHVVSGNIALTATVDILEDIAQHNGPEKFLLALGYAGWGAGQLDAEVQANSWLVIDADDEIVFGKGLDEKWQHAVNNLGFDINLLMAEGGNA